MQVDGAARALPGLCVQPRHRADRLAPVEADLEAEEVAIELEGPVHVANADRDV
jgi:hypothetical protein